MTKWFAAGLVAISLGGLAAGGSAQSATVSETMLDFHDRLRAARDALVFPNLETFQGLMSYLSTSQPAPDTLPPAQRRHIRKVQQLAATAETTKDLASAAKLMGKVTLECGGCHRSTQRGPTFPPAPIPEEVRNASEHMDRYRWALERLWEGLATDQLTRWNVGARELREGTLALDTLPKSARTAEAKQWTEQLHGLSKQAPRAKSGPQRARLLASIVEKCGQCHAASGLTETGEAEAGEAESR